MEEKIRLLEYALNSLKNESEFIIQTNDRLNAQIQNIISFCAIILSLLIVFMGPHMLRGHGYIFFLASITVFMFILVACFFLISRDAIKLLDRKRMDVNKFITDINKEDDNSGKNKIIEYLKDSIKNYTQSNNELQFITRRKGAMIKGYYICIIMGLILLLLLFEVQVMHL